MCGPKFCSMHHSRTIEDGIAAMAREAGLANGEADGEADGGADGEADGALPVVDGSGAAAWR
jgi:hypothetical protein